MASPVDDLLKFIADTRAKGIPDALIFRGIQAAVLTITEQEFIGVEVERGPVERKPRVVGFTR